MSAGGLPVADVCLSVFQSSANPGLDLLAKLDLVNSSSVSAVSEYEAVSAVCEYQSVSAELLRVLSRYCM